MISRELFIKTIDAIEKQFKHDEKCSEALSILFDDGVGFYNYFTVLSALENILKEEMSDNHKDSWIDYFIYELDFGEKWTKDSITHQDIDGKKISIKMRNAGELYDYLILNK